MDLVKVSIVIKNISPMDMMSSDVPPDNGAAAVTLTEDGAYTGEEYISENADENALRVDGAAVTLTNVTVNKAGGESSNTETGDFYGMNAALLAQNAATLTLDSATIDSSAVNGNGAVAYGPGTTVNISNSVIRTYERCSGGIHTIGGAVMNATQLDIETFGDSAAAIRSDRGGGAVTVEGGSYVTNGSNSPAIYSTADIAVRNAILTANSSEAVVVEGKNSVELIDCALTGSMKDSDDVENVHNIMLYQSMSGDAEAGVSRFSATGGSITGKVGDMFYITNTACEISLKNVLLSLPSDVLFKSLRQHRSPRLGPGRRKRRQLHLYRLLPAPYRHRDSGRYIQPHNDA